MVMSQYDARYRIIKLHKLTFPMDVFYRRLIILFIFLFIFCVSINTMFVAINHFKLHEFCKEYGYEDGKCNDKKVIAAMSRYSVLIALFSGISILTTGFWASVSNRLGRKNIILITLFGMFLFMIMIIYYGIDQSY